MSNFSGIFAVVVTYHPNLAVLSELLERVSSQVDQIVVVDNGSELNLASWWHSKQSACPGKIIMLGQNYGIAKAQNTGIQFAKLCNAKFVLLLDQDSMPMVDMAQKLYLAHTRLVDSGVRVAAVGPRYIDERSPDRPSFSRISGLRLHRLACRSNNDIFLVDFVIASGSLISMQTLETVGNMCEPFFIDQVDIEWGLRAQSLGYQSYGVCAAVMKHALGETPLSIFGLRMLNHGPLRHYYIFRNAIRLLFRSNTPLGWRMRFLRVIISRMVIYPLFVAPRLRYLSMMSLGIWHGLIGRMGML